MGKKSIIVLLCITALVMIGMYAAFISRININGTAEITSEWNLQFTNIVASNRTSGVTEIKTPSAVGTTATFNVGLKAPGDEITYVITLSNLGTINAIVNDITTSDAGNDAIIFEVIDLAKGDKIAKQSTKDFKVKISFDSSVTSQPSNENKTLSITINCTQDLGQMIIPDISGDSIVKLSSKILSLNAAQSDSEIDFAYTSEEDGTSGLYYTNKNTQNNKTTYYFRGNVDNNYVKFGKENGQDIYWRIIRINEDGSIRLIYQGNSATATGIDSLIEQSPFNSNFNDNANVGYMYTVGSAIGRDTSSTIKGVLDNWYADNLETNYSGYLTTTGFCNDRSIYSGNGIGKNETYYGPFNRLQNNKSPQFVCPNPTNDLFNTKVGLITADEAAYAGLVRSKSNFNVYLNADSDYWTISSRAYYGNSARVWYVGSENNLYSLYSEGVGNVSEGIGIRPVINLRSDVEIEPGGDGRIGSEYVIKIS